MIISTFAISTISTHLHSKKEERLNVRNVFFVNNYLDILTKSSPLHDPAECPGSYLPAHAEPRARELNGAVVGEEIDLEMCLITQTISRHLLCDNLTELVKSMINLLVRTWSERAEGGALGSIDLGSP